MQMATFPTTQWETLHYLRALGFLVADGVIQRFDDLDDVIAYVEGFVDAPPRFAL